MYTKILVVTLKYGLKHQVVREEEKHNNLQEKVRVIGLMNDGKSSKIVTKFAATAANCYSFCV